MTYNTCSTCVDEAKERNRDMDTILIKAKKQAIEDTKVKAICMDEATGLFIANAEDAIREHYHIKHFVSNL